MNPLDHPICLASPLRLAPSDWIEHVPFGMFLIDILRPRLVVELGTYCGVSYCAFCQAVQQLGVSTTCYAIGSWQGDTHTGPYGPEVLADLRAHHDPLYARFSQLIQSNFEDAQSYFEDVSIDLLHIDGHHTYDAVKGDGERWLPKMSSSGVMLLHGISAREGDFGIRRLWEELKPVYPHLEFFHGYGLGLIAVGESLSPQLQSLLGLSEEAMDHVRAFFHALGARAALQSRQAQLPTKDDVEALTGQVKNQERVVQAYGVEGRYLSSWIADLAVKNAERGAAIDDLNAGMAERDQMIHTLHAEVAGRDQKIHALTAQVTARDATIDGLNARVGEQDELIEALSGQISGWERHWSNVQMTLGWRVITGLRRVRRLLAPPDSKREGLWFLLLRRKHASESAPPEAP